MTRTALITGGNRGIGQEIARSLASDGWDVLVAARDRAKGQAAAARLRKETGGRLKAVAWRAEDTELGRRLMAGGGGLHVVGKLKADDWNGRSGVELEIEDAADPRRNA